jgi:hypothetical protein
MFLDETAFDLETEHDNYGKGPQLKQGGQFDIPKSRNSNMLIS